MDIEACNNHCLAQEEVTETSPFDQKMLVDNVIDRTLALADIDTFESLHLKCDPITAIQLRECYMHRLLLAITCTRITGVQYTQLGALLTNGCYE